MSASEIIYTEFHDARIGRIVVLASGNVQIEFSHMSSFHGKDQKISEVWSASATLRLSGVSRFEIDEKMDAEDYISQGSLLDSQGNEIALLPVGCDKQAHSLKLLLAGSGATINLLLESATLLSLQPQSKLEDWPFKDR